MEIRSNNARIYFRSLGAEDADVLAQKANNYQIAYNIAEWGTFPHPYTKDIALSFIELATKMQMEGRELHMGIRLVEGDVLIGVIGLTDISAKNRKARIGFWIEQALWKKGYGSEAAAIMVEYAFSKLGLHKIEARVFALNEASAKIFEKIGFKREGLLRDNVFHKDDFADELVFGLLKSEYQSKLSISAKD